MGKVYDEEDAELVRRKGREYRFSLGCYDAWCKNTTLVNVSKGTLKNSNSDER